MENSILIGSWSGVSGGSITPAINEGMRLRELWLEFAGDAAAGVTPSFDAMGQILVRHTGPGSHGQIVQADTLAPLALQQNRRGGIVDASYAAGGACYGSYCIYYAYEPGDEVNALYFMKGQGLSIVFGSTAGGAAVWDSLTVEVYAVYADDQDSCQLYVPITTQRQITLGGTTPIQLEDNLLEVSSTAGSLSNPTSIQLLSGEKIQQEGSWEGLKRKANSKYPIEATQTTLQMVLHKTFLKPVQIFECVRSGVTLRYNGGSGTTQLFQRFCKFDTQSTSSSLVNTRAVAEAKRAALLEGTLIPTELKQVVLPALSPIGQTALTARAKAAAVSSPLERAQATVLGVI